MPMRKKQGKQKEAVDWYQVADLLIKLLNVIVVLILGLLALK
jgi:hypothetical protein